MVLIAATGAPVMQAQPVPVPIQSTAVQIPGSVLGHQCIQPDVKRQLSSTPCAGCCDLFVQALITGAFSMVYQSMAMGCFPRFRVHHTSEEVGGQIFIPEVGRYFSRISILLVDPTCSMPAAASTAASMLESYLQAFCYHWQCCQHQRWYGALCLLMPAGELHLAGAVCGRCGGLSVWHSHRQCLW